MGKYLFSKVDSFFEISRYGSSVKTEIIAGLTTFLTASYIIFVNPSILAEAGMDKAALITVTCFVSSLATFLMAFWPRVPFMMAPGMGLNAFFTYTLVIGRGVSWQTALGVVFFSGIVFLVLTIAGIRKKILVAIPEQLRLATSVGIGLFISFIGAQNLGLVVKNEQVLVGLGALGPKIILGLIGILIIVILEVKRVKGALLLGIIGTSFLGIIFGQSMAPKAILSYPPSIMPVAFKLDLIDALSISMWAYIFSFMYVDLFDSLGTIVGVAYQANMVEKDGAIKKLGPMLGADAIATSVGAVLGTSTTTTYIESAAGVTAGGRTGLTAAVTGALFLVAAFFSPVIAAVPPFATAPALIVVGIFMMRGLGRINFERFDLATPAFLTIVLMPFTYSISNGILFGFLAYVAIKMLLGKFEDLNYLLYIIAALSLMNLVV